MLNKIQSISVPLIITPNGDTVFPGKLAQRQNDAAPNAKRLLLVVRFSQLRPFSGVTEETRRKLLPKSCGETAAPGYCCA